MEHSSVEAAADRLEQLGWEVIRVKPDVMGHIDANEVMAAVDRSTVLVSCMCVNNEVGTILPIGQDCQRSAAQKSGNACPLRLRAGAGQTAAFHAATGFGFGDGERSQNLRTKRFRRFVRAPGHTGTAAATGRRTGEKAAPGY